MYKYTATGNSLSKKETGSFLQYPFKIGKAITIHKSQGQTFDNVMLSPEIFANGQLYVALSRVKSPEGLSLLSPISENDVFPNKTVDDFVLNGYKFTETKSTSIKKNV